MSSPLRQALAHGQSIWLDNISRELILSGALRQWVAEEGIRGVTSNPAIFEKAIARSNDYDPAIHALLAQGAHDALDVFERLAVQDIQLGCDLLRPVWEESGGRDGFVSLEVSPHLAHDTEGTITEAHRLARAVSRPNLMIKVPATPAGIPAIERLIADGLNVNVTLLFAVDAYEAVHHAYMAGLEQRLARGLSVASANSVASFFVSRIDAAVGQQIAVALEGETPPERSERLQGLEAKVAIANAQLAYAHFLEALSDTRWQRLAAAGAHPQRVLWASTGTKDPALPRTLYVDNLIGQHTVNTLPDATLEAFRQEGVARDVLGHDPAALRAQARPVLEELADLGISLKAITDSLLTKGCALFADAFDGLLGSVESKRRQILESAIPPMQITPGAQAEAIAAAATAWQQADGSRRLWQRDATLFSDSDEARWMGWLDLPAAAPEQAIGSRSLREAIAAHPAETVVVVGMGGSSLWPDVLGRTFDPAVLAASPDTDRITHRNARRRRLAVIDTTVPDAVESMLARLDLERCLFFVASKSGSTIEPNALFELLHARLAEKLGAQTASRHFVAITDPGSELEARAARLGFLGAALGRPDVGGRFSALSPFGLLPAEAMGLDAEAMLVRARRMSAACQPFVPPDQNPGVALGLALGTLVRHGRDKLTLSTAPALASFAGWIEQLIAESTGKHGQGLVPIAGEPLDTPKRYGADRIFVDIELGAEADPETDPETDAAAVAVPAADADADADAATAERHAKLDALEAAGHPVIRIRLAERLDLVQEVFRWELATAVVGSLLGQNPFDQPDVEAAKIASRELMARADQAGESGAGLPGHAADLEIEGVRLFVTPALGEARTARAADKANTASTAGTPTDPAAWISALLGSLEPRDTFVINAFLEDTDTTRSLLQSIREAIGRRHQIATTLDFGPRYLHSTGQLQKGGPDQLAGLQLWQGAGSRAAGRLAIPGMGGDFGLLAEAQAAGDFGVLGERGRRMIGIDVGVDPMATLGRLRGWIEEGLGES